MARQPRVFASGLFYHVMARGNNRQPTFLSDRDYHSYLARLDKYRRRDGLVLYAYCLMPNHIHLLARTSSVPLAKFMQSLQQSYTQYFNRMHRRVGHLFQGRYKAVLCDRDEYLLWLVRYIHLNPVRAGLGRSPDEYPYSGHRAYLAEDENGLVDTGLVLRILGGRDAYRRLLLAGSGDGHGPDGYRLGLGDLAHVKPSETVARTGHRAGAPGPPGSNGALDATLSDLAIRLHIDPEVLRGPGRRRAICQARARIANTLVRRLGYRVGEVAAALGRDISTVSLMISRITDRMATTDPTPDVPGTSEHCSISNCKA